MLWGYRLWHSVFDFKMVPGVERAQLSAVRPWRTSTWLKVTRRPIVHARTEKLGGFTQAPAQTVAVAGQLIGHAAHNWRCNIVFTCVRSAEPFN
jgi:hypothetical protein